MAPPRIHGTTARPAIREDVEAIAALIAACEIADNGIAEVHPTDVEQSFDLAGEDGELIVIEDAFNEWPDRKPSSYAKWSGRMIGHAAFAPDLSRLAYEGEELVGAVLSMDYAGEEEGWIEQIQRRPRTATGASARPCCSRLSPRFTPAAGGRWGYRRTRNRARALSTNGSACGCAGPTPRGSRT